MGLRGGEPPSAVAGSASFVQCPYLPPGALSTPAICPDADKTNFTGPE